MTPFIISLPYDHYTLINLHNWLLGNSQQVHNLSVVVCRHFVVNCVHVCVLTQLVAIASKCTDLDVCAFHNYHVMTELSCGVFNSPCTLAHLYCIYIYFLN